MFIKRGQSNRCNQGRDGVRAKLPSEFVGRAIQKVTDVPVKVLPYYMLVPYNDHFGRNEFCLPNDKFLFLVMYDVHSTAGRKNPQGVIKAYKEAFSTQEVGLVIKINNGTQKDIKKLKEQLEGYKNVCYMTETIDKDRVNSLIRCCDVLVSLHRTGTIICIKEKRICESCIG